MSIHDVYAGRLAEVTPADPVNIISDKLVALNLDEARQLNNVLEDLDSQITSPTVGRSSSPSVTYNPLKLDAGRRTPQAGLPRSSTQAAAATYGQWIIAYELPRTLLSAFAEAMPVRSVHERLLDMIPSDNAPLPPQPRQAAPSAVLTKYFWLLDLRDRLWAESKVLELKSRRDAILPGVGSAVLDFVYKAIDKVSDGLLYIEAAFPDRSDEYRLLERQKFLLYQQKHPLRLIQPYLVSALPPMPDYTLVERAALARRNIHTRPFNNIPSTLPARVAAY